MVNPNAFIIYHSQLENASKVVLSLKRSCIINFFKSFLKNYKTVFLLILLLNLNPVFKSQTHHKMQNLLCAIFKFSVTTCPWKSSIKLTDAISHVYESEN